jgi:hypothetical protein
LGVYSGPNALAGNCLGKEAIIMVKQWLKGNKTANSAKSHRFFGESKNYAFQFSD